MFHLYAQYEYWLAASQLGLAMLGMGATLKVRDFATVVRSPKGIVVGTTIQIIGVPLLAALFLWGFKLDTGVAVGLALVAAIPGGTMSNVFTFLGRGHTALSIALTGVATLACLVTTPIILGLLVQQHMPPSFVMPAGQIAREIALILLLPLALGMVFLKILPAAAATFSRSCIRGSVFFILLIIIGALGSGRIDLARYGLYNLSVVLLFLAVLTALSWVLPIALKLSRPDTTAINIETSLRNANLGLLIKASLFPAATGVAAGAADALGDNVLFTLLAYGGASLFLGIGQIYLHRYFNRLQPVTYPN
jgi:BASS family bile acid:Na+ symporter